MRIDISTEGIEREKVDAVVQKFQEAGFTLTGDDIYDVIGIIGNVNDMETAVQILRLVGLEN